MGRQYAVRIYSKIWTWTGYITAPFHAASACCLAIYRSLAVPILHFKNLDTAPKSGQNITNSVLPHTFSYFSHHSSHPLTRICEKFRMGLEIWTRRFSQSRDAEIVRGATRAEIGKRRSVEIRLHTTLKRKLKGRVFIPHFKRKR